jgi:hypothetical protein
VMRCAPANAVEKVIWKVACTWFPDPVRELPEDTEQTEFAGDARRGRPQPPAVVT